MGDENLRLAFQAAKRRGMHDTVFIPLKRATLGFARLRNGAPPRRIGIGRIDGERAD